MYAALVLAGVATNLLALASRAGSKVLGLDLPAARPFDSWWLQAIGHLHALGRRRRPARRALLVPLQRRGRARRPQRVIYVGIDDTDIVGSPGTNQLARLIVRRLGSVARGAVICRHQLFFDPRVPYTSGNGSASIQLPRGGDVAARRAPRHACAR